MNLDLGIIQWIPVTTSSLACNLRHKLHFICLLTIRDVEERIIGPIFFRETINANRYQFSSDNFVSWKSKRGSIVSFNKIPLLHTQLL